MTGLGSIRSATMPTFQGRVRAPSGVAGFAVPGDFAADPLASTAPAQPVALSGLLALQESEPAPDRAARRRARELLIALAALQRALLAGGGLEDALSQLAMLTRDMPVAFDPALRAVVAMIRSRARVELARRSTQAALQPGGKTRY